MSISITLPEVTSDDNGKILKMVNGEWTKVNPVPPVYEVPSANDAVVADIFGSGGDGILILVPELPESVFGVQYDAGDGSVITLYCYKQLVTESVIVDPAESYDNAVVFTEAGIPAIIGYVNSLDLTACALVEEKYADKLVPGTQPYVPFNPWGV